MLERDILRRYFRFAVDDSVLVAGGDDAAVVLPPSPSLPLAISSDTLSEAVHFFADADAFTLARKSLAVSLSDMAAMGARPLWATLALSANRDGEWLRKFALGAASIAEEYQFNLVGGDLCRAAAVSVTTTVIGEAKRPITRAAACAGDDVWLSGTIGEAALALAMLKKSSPPAAEFSPAESSPLFERLHNPTPRVGLGRRLSGVATAAVDLSDGLIAAAREIAEASRVKIILQEPLLPLGDVLPRLPAAAARQFALGGGDDFELLFTAPRGGRDAVAEIGDAAAMPSLTRVGRADHGHGVAVMNEQGELPCLPSGYAHEFGE